MKNKQLFLIILIIHSIVCSTSLAQSKQPNQPNQKSSSVLTIDVNWDDFLARHDLVWNRAPMDWYDSPFMGNGMLGSMFYQQDDHHIRIDVGRSDVEDHQKSGGAFLAQSRLPIGYFTLKTEGKIIDFKGRLDLYNAEARTRIKTESGSIDIQAFVHSEDMVICYRLRSSSGEKELKLVWHPLKAISPARKIAEETAKKVGVENLNSHFKDWYESEYLYNADPEISLEDGINVCRQTLVSGGETGTAWKVRKDSEGSKVLFVSIDHSYPERNAVNTVLSNIRNVDTEPFDKFIQRHRNWWHNYYPASFVSLEDTKMESFYWIQVYKFASGARKDRAFMDVMGPWWVNSIWANGWFNLNTQLSYWFLSTANRLDLAESLFKKLDEKLPTLIENMPERFENQCAGLYTIAPQTFKSPFPESLQSLGDLTWLCHDYWMMLQRTMDAERITEKFFPLLKKAVNTYFYVMKEGTDGKIHLPKALSPEYGWGEDTNYNLALFRWGCQTLLEICKRYDIEDSLIPEWKDVLIRLVDYPINENGYMIAAGVPFEKSHRHYSHLLMFYPLELVNMEQENNADIIRKSINHWINYPGPGNCGYSWSGASAMYALMQDGEKAAFYLDRFLRQSELYPDNASRLHPTTMYTETNSFNPVTETPFSACDALQKMLLQSWGGKIRVFPAVPDSWKDLSFDGLLAEGGFEVSAVRKAGKTQFVCIKSLAGEPCRLITDLEFDHIEGVQNSAVKTLKDGSLDIDLKKGEEIILYAKDATHSPVITPVAAITEKCNSFGLK